METSGSPVSLRGCAALPDIFSALLDLVPDRPSELPHPNAFEARPREAGREQDNPVARSVDNFAASARPAAAKIPKSIVMAAQAATTMR